MSKELKPRRCQVIRERMFFSGFANYHIAPNASHRALLNDADALLDSSLATIEMIWSQLSEEGSELSQNPREAARVLGGAVYALNMVRNQLSSIEVST